MLQNLHRRKSLRPALRAVVLSLALAVAVTPAASAAEPTAPAFGSSIDRYGAYTVESTCSPTEKPGALQLRSLILNTYGAASTNIVRPCVEGTNSGHEEGRALDWMRSIRTASEKQQVEAFINWLLKSDAYGNKHAMARRLGVMYLMWNGQIWGAYSPDTGWQPQKTGSCALPTSNDTTCHRDHLHISLSWDGALAKTSWYAGTGATASTVTMIDRVAPAPLFTADSVPDVLAVDRRRGGLFTYPGRAGGLSARFQIASSWNSRDQLTSVGDLTRDGRADLVTRRPADGTLWLHPGDGQGRLKSPKKIGNGWNGMSSITGVGDMTGDGVPDLLAVQKSDGRMWLYPGTRQGTLGARKQVGGPSTTRSMMTGVGDLDGDGRVDVVAVDSKDGTLWLFHGNGAAGWRKFTKIGTGWTSMAQLGGAGDLTGDGRNDLLAVEKSTGYLKLYPGTGNGALGRARQIGSGWKSYSIAS